MTSDTPFAIPFPGIPAVVDGSEAIASVETRISEMACAYPITPSTTMAAVFQSAVADGLPNLWGTPLRFIELESEHSSASSAAGAALAGTRVTNFTAGQGLDLIAAAYDGVIDVTAALIEPAAADVPAREPRQQLVEVAR